MYLMFSKGDTLLGYTQMQMMSYDEDAFKYLYAVELDSDGIVYDNKMIVKLYDANGILTNVKVPIGSVDISVCIYRDEKQGEASFNYAETDTGMPRFDQMILSTSSPTVS